MKLYMHRWRNNKSLEKQKQNKHFEKIDILIINYQKFQNIWMFWNLISRPFPIIQTPFQLNNAISRKTDLLKQHYSDNIIQIITI